ncbi:thioredoxin-T [Drosophila yakuba]|uniref:ThioredoxinT n=1 Tax=Drosophila yakuba TaxID=7245 RepID=B4PZR9_DROYA|nr:thioredoxin-T [Drosophila yakuba]EDX01136.1 ThioredoxinT [Drosophila yakuba]
MVYLVRNKADLDKQLTLAEGKLVVIDFYANWCGPCKIIAPKLEELAEQYSDRTVVLKVNVDENEDIAIEYNVTSMPTFVFIRAGDVLDVFVGCNAEKLSKSMEKYAASGSEPLHSSVQLLESDEESSANPSAASSDSEDDVVICEVSAHDQEAVLEH